MFFVIMKSYVKVNFKEGNNNNNNDTTRYRTKFKQMATNVLHFP